MPQAMSPKKRRSQPQGSFLAVSLASRASALSGSSVVMAVPPLALLGLLCGAVLEPLHLRRLLALVGLLGPDPGDGRPDVVVGELAGEGGHAAAGIARAADPGLGVAAPGDEGEPGAVGHVPLLSQEHVVDEVRGHAFLAAPF